MSLPHLPRVHKNRSSCLSIFPLCLLAFSLSEAYADTIIVPDRGYLQYLQPATEGDGNVILLKGSAQAATGGPWALAGGWAYTGTPVTIKFIAMSALLPLSAVPFSVGT